MSVVFTLQQSVPEIKSPDIVAITGENILISGTEFKKNISQVVLSGINNPDIIYNFFGEPEKNIRGINNTIYEDAILFTIQTDLEKQKYKLSVSNAAGLSTNSINLHILDKPKILSVEKQSAFPNEYIRVSGTNFYPGSNLFFIDSNNQKIPISIQDTGLYKVTGYTINDFGTGYQVGERISLNNINKLYLQDSSGSFIVGTTGTSGSLATLNIEDSGIFTVVNNNPIEFNTTFGRNANITFLYEKSLSTNSLEFIEFLTPTNVTKNQAIYIENLKYKSPSVLNINSIDISKTGFSILGVPKVFSVNPSTGYNNEDYITLSGDNLIYVNSVDIGSLKNIPFNILNEDIIFKIPYLAERNSIQVNASYGFDISDQKLDILYRAVNPSGFSPNDILLTGARVAISGYNLQRINYINLGFQNITRDKINITYSGENHLAVFTVPDNYQTNQIRIFSLDYPNSGTLIESIETNNRLIASTKLNPDLINIRYLSGIQGAKYLDEVEIYTPSGVSGDYGNLSNSEIFFNTPTGLLGLVECYVVSGIKLNNTPTGIKFKIPREIKNPRSPIKIRRNKFGEEYVLPLNKSLDILPSIIYNSTSNTLFDNMGEIIISGINSTNVNQLFFSGYSGTTNIFGFKNIKITDGEIIEKDIYAVTGENEQGYTRFRTKIGGDIVGSGELFLFNSYFDTGIGYENNIITQNQNIRISPISGYRPPNSPIFTSPGYVYSPLDQPFFYPIQTNSKATRFQISATNISGVGTELFPPGINETLNTANQIYGVPTSGGIFYIKIRALDGDKPDEGMILNAALGYSGRSLTGPGIVYRGDWRNDIGYAGDNLRRDVVKYIFGGVNYWYAASTNIDSTPNPTNPNWIPFTNEFSATATQILLAERSNITSELNVGTAGLFSGYIKTANDIDTNLGSGFFLGYDESFNPGKPKFRVGNSQNYIKFDGLGLDIVGPLSGVVTSAKDIDANNSVSAKYAVALGEKNIITSRSDNALVCGSTNTISGALRSAILGGKNNLIKQLSTFNSINSSIVGGELNEIIGSYCNIAGGYSNKIDASQTGLAAIANQSFGLSLTGTISGITGQINASYLQQVFTNDLVVINTIKSNKNYELNNINNIGNSGFNFYLNSGIYTPDIVDLYSWVSLKVENLFSGSFENKNINPICEFKVTKSGIPAGTSNFLYNFIEPFSSVVKNDNIVILGNILGTGGDLIKNYSITGANRSGFYIKFPSALNQNAIGHFYLGETGYFTGLELNDSYKLEIGKIQPFFNLHTGSSTEFSIDNAQINNIVFNNINKINSENFYLSNLIQRTSTGIPFNLSKPISSEDEYLCFEYLSYTGRITGQNIQIFTGQLLSGNKTYEINLPYAFTGTNYTVIINQINPYDNYYHYFISGKKSGSFSINFTSPLENNIDINIGAFNTGIYTYNNITYSSYIRTLSGTNINQTLYNISHQNSNKPQFILYSLENKTNDLNTYSLNTNYINETGFQIKISKDINTGQVFDINILSILNTGIFTASSANMATIANSNRILTGNIQVILNHNDFTNNPRVFARPYLNENLPFKLTNIQKEYFLLDLISGYPITNLENLYIDYFVTDLPTDKNIAKLTLRDYDYARLASFGFDDAGSNCIVGGTGNSIKGVVSTIGGGTRNKIIGDFNIIAGGRSNYVGDGTEIDSKYPQIGFCNAIGGLNNTLSGNIQFSTILGGSGNFLQNSNEDLNIEGSTIFGGNKNIISGSYSICAGRNININHKGCAFLSDSTTGDKKSFRENTIFLHYSGGVYITGVANGTSPLILEYNKIPTSTAGLPQGAIYRDGSNFLKIVP